MKRDELIEVMAKAIGSKRYAAIIDEVWESYTPEAKAALQAIEDAGLTIAPFEPTVRMLTAPACDGEDGLGFSSGDKEDIYTAMIKAAQEEM